VLPCVGISPAAQPFFATLLRTLFPSHWLVVVTDSLKTQESFHQDLETWLVLSRREARGERRGLEQAVSAGADLSSRPSTLDSRPLFYPAWEILPHEGKLPHADVISDRLETLVALSDGSKPKTKGSKLIVTTVTALLQRTFAPEALRARTRKLERGDRSDPLDLAGWLKEQGYEPEAQVTQKGELALRGGILDVFPLTSPWPVRLEFFGEELESLRYFDPLTQISRQEITSAVLPPGGELGILKAGGQRPEVGGHNELGPATLLDYFPRETIFLLCEPELLAERANEYAQQVPPNDPFFISWQALRQHAIAKEASLLEVIEAAEARSSAALDCGGLSPQSLSTSKTTGREPATEGAIEPAHSGPLAPDSRTGARLESCDLRFESLDVFRPLIERTPEPQVVEAQRREFFAQLHRWLRQGYAVHVFCNNDGERQRFGEIWEELGFGRETKVEGREPESDVLP